MSGPFIFISRSKVKPGSWEGYAKHCRVVTDLVESWEPRMIGFNNYSNEDGTEVSCVQVHPDEESMEAHLKIFFERIAADAFDALETYEIDVYGTPSESVMESLEKVPAKVRVLAVHDKGFLRPQPL